MCAPPPEESLAAAAGEPISVRTDVRPDGLGVVHVSGDIDIDTAPALDAALSSLMAAGATHIAIGLAGVEFLDSVAINTLVRANLKIRSRGGRLRLAAVREHPRRLFGLLGMDQVIPLDE